MSSPLAGKNVVLGVTGGIAAYKAVELCRFLVDGGARVVPVLTEDSQRFVGEVTFSALASERARVSMWDDADPIPHTRLGQGADLMVIAPATARFIGCYAAGISEGLLGATVLATRAPVVVCPAMHTEMWEHPAVQANIATLRARGVHIVGPGSGRLAGGDEGAGRLAEPSHIFGEVEAVLRGAAGGAAVRQDLDGVHVLVTAGGTREPIDPVRFIANRSSGKQGYAIADAARTRGADVVLVTSSELDPPAGVKAVRVDTAESMHHAVMEHLNASHVVVMAAAVSDFRPAQRAAKKLSRSQGITEIRLERTVDILADVMKQKKPGQVVVGFSAETHDVEKRSAMKLADKGVDLLVVNDVSAPGAGFEHDTNEVTILGAESPRRVPMASKVEVAHAVLDTVVSRLHGHDRSNGGGGIPGSDS